MKKNKLDYGFIQEAANALDQEYRCFLDYIASHHVKLSARTGNLGKQDCAAINQLFRLVKEPYEKAGRTQNYYGVIDFFYYFSWYGDILHETKRKGGGHTLQASDRCAQFLEMPPSEKYLLMLAVWLFHYRQDAADPFYNNCFDLNAVINADEGKEIIYPYSSSEYQPWQYTYYADIRILALFGLLQISWLENGAPQSNRTLENKFRIRTLTLTKAGALWQKNTKKLLKHSNWLTGIEFSTVLDTYGKLIADYSSEMKQRLLDFWENPAEPGQYAIQLKVSVASCVRRITLQDACTLDDLHCYIQKSVDFGMDHLYYFQIGSGSRQKKYYAPQCDDENYLADEFTLADLHLYEGLHFQYLFDFGDQWLFEITVEHILEKNMPVTEIEIVSGENPDQYAW